VHLERHQQSAIAWTLLPVIVIWQINGLYLPALAQVSVAAFWLADLCQWILLPSVLMTALATLRWQSLMFGTLLVFLTMGLAFVGARNISWTRLGHPTGFFSFPGVFPSGLMGGVVWLYSAVTAGTVESIFC